MASPVCNANERFDSWATKVGQITGGAGVNCEMQKHCSSCRVRPPSSHVCLPDTRNESRNSRDINPVSCLSQTMN